MNCEHCNNTFKNISVLNTHKKTAKYCLILQNKNNTEFTCLKCKKQFSTKNRLLTHNEICEKKEISISIEQYKKENEFLREQLKEKDIQFKEQLKEKDLQIKELQNQLANIAMSAVNKPINIQNIKHNTNTQRINNTINNLIPITENYLKEQAEFLTLEHVKNGINGYVQYALDYPLKDRIVCTDFSRRKIKYKDENGDLIDDPEMVILTQKLFKAIEDKNDILISQYIKELHEKYKVLIMEPNNEMNDEESFQYANKLEMITNELFRIKNQNKNIKDIANGNKNDIYYKLVKDICMKTVN